MPRGFIAIDWGTTSFRAFRMSATGEVLDRRGSADGILSVSNGAFAPVLMDAIGDWLGDDPEMPVVASGMITSRNGWVETAYCETPVGVADLASALTQVSVPDGPTVHFITGVCHRDETQHPDIMRGEETQIFGCIRDEDGAGDLPGLFLLPGTHSKWVETRGGAITSFATYMTGEVYALLKDHSILGKLFRQTTGLGPGFRRGVIDRASSSKSLLNQIFGARTMVLFDQLTEDEAADYLSGLLIGEEVKHAVSGMSDGEGRHVTIVGRGDLAARYAEALDHMGIHHQLASEDAAALGQYAISKAGGLIT